MRRTILVGISFLVMLLLLTLIWMSQKPKAVVVNEDPTESQPVAMALVVVRDSNQGAILEDRNLRWKALDESTDIEIGDLFLKGLFEKKELVGALLTRPLLRGEPITWDSILMPQDSHYISALLSPGARALTLKLPVSEVGSGLIRPGNRVDIALTSSTSNLGLDEQSNDDPNNDDPINLGEASNVATEIILQNIRLLAINDQKFSDVGSKESEEALYDLTYNSDEYVLTTFELSLEQASKLTLAKQLGKISLILRSSQVLGEEHSDTTWAHEVSTNHNASSKPFQAVKIYND
ncbi:Flp pilus assembly protein CpaB [Vibrio sp. S9_S30]|uniref:Flp pilus assembly protein CpaB n=1 Tax=Vibrio sp. S9_S30 TaxID=2720226 RepID=UPI001680CAD5|nr:Flp pilus assembly protein CpaB [Vibrio sp. S9_S30]MBD1556174.1 Flp pilus assembly protein CpaB [Vibrio sp. S9_S30]